MSARQPKKATRVRAALRRAVVLASAVVARTVLTRTVLTSTAVAPVVLTSALLPALLLLSSAAAAQTYPTKVVSIVVPFPAGGTADVFARGIAPKLSAAWGQPVIVENRAGAGGNIAAEYVARAAADGHIIFLAPDPVLSTNQLIYPKLAYDAKRDFAPVTRLVEFPSVIVVNTSTGAKTLKDLQSLARAKPGTLNYSSFGTGSAPHIGMEMFKQIAGVDIVHVPYKGLAEALPALISNDVQVLFVGHNVSQNGATRDGRLRVLAVAGERRDPLIPDVPTFAEAGFPAMKGPNYWGFVVPAATPRTVVEKIRTDAAKVLKDPEIVERFGKRDGYELIGDTPEQFAARIQELTDIWAPVIKGARIRID